MIDVHEVMDHNAELLAEVKRLEAENVRLREALAYEARVVAAQTLDVKALGKGRRMQLINCIQRMEETAVTGHNPNQRKGRFGVPLTDLFAQGSEQ